MRSEWLVKLLKRGGFSGILGRKEGWIRIGSGKLDAVCDHSLACGDGVGCSDSVQAQ